MLLLQSPSVSANGISAITAILSVTATIVTLALGYFFKYLVDRRSSSGTIGTSSADILWQQAQHMREMLMEEKAKAEEQRDKLLESQASQIIPALGVLNTSISVTHEVMTRIIDAVETNRKQIEELQRELRERNQIHPPKAQTSRRTDPGAATPPRAQPGH